MASKDASISGVAVELEQLALRRSTAAAPLLANLLSPGGSGRQADRLALSAATAAAGSSAWAEVLSLEPQQPLEPPYGAPFQQKEAGKQLAVSVHFFDTAAGPGAAPPTGALAPGRVRCSVALGRVLVAHAPGFVTNMVLLTRQYQAGAGWQLGGAEAGVGGMGAHAGDSPGALGTMAEDLALARPAEEPPEHSNGTGGASDVDGGSRSGAPSPLAQTLQPQLVLECRVSQLELLALSSQAPEAAALVLRLRQLELRSGPLNWEAPWNSRLRHALLSPPQGEPGRMGGA